MGCLSPCSGVGKMPLSGCTTDQRHIERGGAARACAHMRLARYLRGASVPNPPPRLPQQRCSGLRMTRGSLKKWSPISKPRSRQKDRPTHLARTQKCWGGTQQFRSSLARVLRKHSLHLKHQDRGQDALGRDARKVVILKRRRKAAENRLPRAASRPVGGKTGQGCGSPPSGEAQTSGDNTQWVAGRLRDHPPKEGLIVSTFPPGAEWVSKARTEGCRGKRYVSWRTGVSSHPLGQKRETGIPVVTPGETERESLAYVQDEYWAGN